MDNIWLKVENIVAKGEMLVLSNFFFCHYDFKKPSAAECDLNKELLYGSWTWNCANDIDFIHLFF